VRNQARAGLLFCCGVMVASAQTPLPADSMGYRLDHDDILGLFPVGPTCQIPLTAPVAIAPAQVQAGAKSKLPPPQPYHFSAHALDYLHETFGPSAIAASALSASASSILNRSLDWGAEGNRYVNHFEASFTQHATRESIEFGVAAVLREDTQFVPSGQERIRTRLKSALYASFFVKGRRGEQIALPRFAAAVGTGWAMHELHPWDRGNPNPWVETTAILSRYMLRSFWHEFEPDVRFHMRNLTLRAHLARP
jgi:hypothetical protein